MRQTTLSLAHIGDQLDVWVRHPVHSTLVPFGVLALVHAVRVSHATRQVAGGHAARLSVWQGFLLNQMLMFGGVVISFMLLGLASPLLTAWPVVVLYGGMHVLLDITPFGAALLNIQDNEVIGLAMDLSFALLDGILRAEGIIDLGIQPVRTHPLPDVAASPFAALFNAALIGGGVPLLIDLFRLDSPTGDWGVRTPAWTKDPWKGTNDIISAAMLGCVYLALTSPTPPSFPLLGAMLHTFDLDTLSSRDIRTFCSLLLGSMLLAEKAYTLAAQPKPMQQKLTTSTPLAVKNGSAKNRKVSSTKKQ